jgi:PAS domain S-box-containing protein
MDVAPQLERRIRREIASRKEAERLLEEKSLELYLKNVELEGSARSLKQQLELIGVILDAVPDIVITCDKNYRIQSVNEAVTALIGYRREELLGECLTTIAPAFSKRPREFAEKSFVIPEINILKKDGGPVPAELRGRTTRMHGETLIVVIIHDISGRKAWERTKEEVYQRLNESRRLEAIGTLASGIAHELNTPIQFIGDNIKFIGDSLKQIHASYLRYDTLKNECGRLGLLKEQVGGIDDFNREIKLEALIKEIFTAMRETADGIIQVRDIVLMVKEFAHPGGTAPEETDMNRIVESALALCRSRTRNVARIETDLMADAPKLFCRRGPIQQVLVNLLVNAVEAIEESGAEGGLIRVASGFHDGAFRISISDNGPGIPDAIREKVFDPFFTTKQVGKGTGQGLALAKDVIVKQHGGRLFLEDAPGFATTFVIELPFGAVDTASKEQKRRI